MSDLPDYVYCDNCQKPFMRSAMILHTPTCQKPSKAESVGKSPVKVDDDKEMSRSDSKGSNMKRKFSQGSDSIASSSAPPKKHPSGSNLATARKAPQEKDDKKEEFKKERKEIEQKLIAEKTKKKKAKKSAPTKPKEKGPVDVERQCGVPLPAGGMCARSLTCKTHSMGAKRAVMGRSMPYDQLLAQYQRKNQAKQAAIANASRPPPVPVFDEYESAPQAVDSDDEVALVMEAIAKSNAKPLERKVIVPVRRRRNFFRTREMFAGAMSLQSNTVQSTLFAQFIPFTMNKIDPNAQATKGGSQSQTNGTKTEGK
ncbi:SAGA-associated factor 73 [Neolecta irregularis DAH-3]|uniref:SAGA-associated factor 73 n=1 Tax=Neolecta irregularis (strain DAH-3) TaxID=1198029 RepID=A0A1U7LKS7_NEOID|nr:SAGA-associated factor 73 [Neolecta irregularis DAH-3]|eukprot:OLL23254.1 SAGA-associated factor 73 [Neolecta irregularis DAH-3]